MKIKKLYQALEDRANPDEIEYNGPFKCIKQNAWLGAGYYFWDTFIDLAHWWGRQGYKGKYVICQAICDNDDNEIFDLVGNTEHLNELHDYIKTLKQYPEFQNKHVTMSIIIEHMKKHSGTFKYNAIRANGINSVNKDFFLRDNRIKFNVGSKAYLDLKPPIQMCFLEKDSLRLRDFRIVYPEDYANNFTI